MKKIKFNKKLFVGIVIGFVLSMSVVYAVSYTGSGNVISYNNSSSGLSSGDVQSALDELYNKKYACPDGYDCYKNKTTLAIGDYVSMTPTLTSATIDTTKTGNSNSQTFNPSELNLWRVISLNADGTVDMVSEYTSSIPIYFSGRTGYMTYIGYLNELASKYENSTYTNGSRYLGYNGQTEYLNSLGSWDCNTGESCNPVESQGGGDDLAWATDLNLVGNVIGTLATTDPGGGRYCYFLASRYYFSSDSYAIRYIDNESKNALLDQRILYYGGGDILTRECLLRPIVTLKSGLTYSGVGNKEFPMEISS